jgi:hypothetical protein
LATPSKIISGQGNEALAALLKLPDGDLLDVPVRPLNLPKLRVVKRKLGKLLTVLLWGDSHFPNHSQSSLDIVQAIAEDVQPDVLSYMGDGVDATDLSEKFKKNPARRETLQDEIDLFRGHLGHMRQSVPDARFIYLEGNHEERMKRVLWNMEGPARALSLLTDVQKVLTWPSLLKLDQLNIEFSAYDKQSKTIFLPKFMLKHGNVVRQKSSYTANAEHSKYGMSGASGHTHRLAQFYHRDHNGNHIWLETGCTCSLEPEYTPDPDWQNGCVVLTLHKETGAFQAESVYMHKRNAIFRQKEYRV